MAGSGKRAIAHRTIKFVERSAATGVGVAKKDAKQSASFYADGGSLLAPGVPLATGDEALQKAWTGLMATPGFALTFAPAKIAVSRAGDLAYEVGEYQLTMNDQKAKP